MTPKFALTSSELELLISFAQTHSSSEAAKELGRDVTVVSRMIQSIQTRYPLFMKQGNRWSLSDQGKSVAALAMNQTLALQRSLKEVSVIRIATTPEFAARMLPRLIKKFSPSLQFEILVSDSEVETLLLEGRANIGIDCGRPNSPLIRFKRVLPESIAIITPKSWKKWNRNEILRRSRVEFIRLPIANCLKLKENMLPPFLRTNSIALAREMVRQGNYWSILPVYTVLEELKRDELASHDIDADAQESFGLWWNAKHPLPKDLFQEFLENLKNQELT